MPSCAWPPAAPGCCSSRPAWPPSVPAPPRPWPGTRLARRSSRAAPRAAPRAPASWLRSPANAARAPQPSLPAPRPGRSSGSRAGLRAQTHGRLPSRPPLRLPAGAARFAPGAPRFSPRSPSSIPRCTSSPLLLFAQAAAGWQAQPPSWQCVQQCLRVAMPSFCAAHRAALTIPHTVPRRPGGAACPPQLPWPELPLSVPQLPLHAP
mmetsp:Transcript_59310/g.190827  ORF Transcript_59310/g.190827 Transcript_59310/m.190827 type:complete len:207 (-) Transcript_59310:2777-3397(-)